MKKIKIGVLVLVIGLIFSYISFNHIDAWVGFLLAIASIGIFISNLIKGVQELNN